ncbi:MAG: enoyl-CoA hydratase/carnithine racemase [Patiriisocius sp.]|jgi:enoyl-CoA hydratase/carnithine racemase
MIDAFDQADADVKAIIITGAGLKPGGGGLLTLRIFECLNV